MEAIYLTQYDGAILGPIARLLGLMINWIFNVLDSIGIPNVGLSIIIFTIIIYILLFPLTFKQQKFSKMSAIMNPEIQAVQAKYKGMRDNESMTKQNEEMQAIYKKYGVSPTGSCIQLLIQMPILFALYRVIYNMPAYVGKVYGVLEPLANEILSSKGGSVIQSLDTARYFQKSDFTLVNTIIDVLNRASTAEWATIREQIPSVAATLDTAQASFLEYYKFGLINIADTPSAILKTGLSTMDFGLMVGALLIPALAALSQWLNVLFMPQASTGDDNSAVASSMKTMNVMMPIMSAVFCFTLPAGMGIYWIASAVVRCVQQVGINKYFDKKGIDSIIEENKAKAEKRAEKEKEVSSQTMKKAVSKNTRNYDSIKNIPSVENKGKAPKAGSMAEKANLVKKYNENNGN